MKQWLATLSVLALAAAFTPAAVAQQASPPPSTQAPTSAAAQPSDEELQTFASAALEVREIGAEWQPRITEADSEEQAAEIQTQARDEMVEAVEQKGLSVERYNEITQQVRSSPELAEKVTTYMQEAR